MKTRAAFSLTIALLTLIAAPAMAATAYTVQNINLRAGPHSSYPVVEILRRGERIELLGCLDGLDWCEVETQGRDHGWVSSRYIQTEQYDRPYTVFESGRNGDIHITVFKQRDYWDRYYRGKPFYKDRDRWEHGKTYHHDRPRPAKPERPAPSTAIQEKPKPKYEKQPTGGRKAYNPLCRMGENDC